MKKIYSVTIDLNNRLDSLYHRLYLNLINLKLYLRNVVTGYVKRGKVGGAEMGEGKKPC